ncbi:hypothetical protein ABEB36_007923 [Hypothenemus hampei]|uniref:LIM zinc-binding domain-containing protein n=1 Tax=Hypothenemus hampei TaxID=57062 RepID=A0ABD1EVN4_HYPHA
MADTVKKSRIVSDEENEKDLEEALLEEFNIRLKNCMSQDDLQQPDHSSKTYENVPQLSPKQQSEIILQKEIEQSYYDEPRTLKQNGIHEEIYENIPEKTDKDEEDQNLYAPEVDLVQQEEYEPIDVEQNVDASSNLYESVEVNKPDEVNFTTPAAAKTSLNLPTISLNDFSEDNQLEKSSVKQRMLSSCDQTSTLLFTQTVTSPMLTPSEENIDFLKGFEDEKENFYENTEFFKNTTPENMYENVEVKREDDTTNGCIETEEEEEIYEQVILSNERGEEERQPEAGCGKSLETDESLEEFIKKEKEVEDMVDEAAATDLSEEVSNNGRISAEVYKELIYHHKTESNSNYYEKYTEVLSKNDKSTISNREKDTETVPAEIVKNLKNQFQTKSETSNSKFNERKKEEVQVQKSATSINQIKTKFEGGDGKVDDDDSTEYSETIVETNVPGEKSIKKKKVKKTRKEEKENISVTKNGSVGQGDINYYNINGKNLCRSFGDLTKLESDRNIRKTRTKSLSDMVTNNHSNNYKLIENVFTGVSVRTLKEKFNGSRTNKHSNSYCRFTDPKVKSSFSKFDALQKKNILHVRSSDSTKAQEKFNNGAQIEMSTNCKACGKQVFQMEQIKAERAVWHKNCFRCIECSKQLTVDTYESNDGTLYCKPHFKALFAPKAVEEDASPKPRRPELIIRENQPLELPPDVVRASDKPDLGLEELQSLNVKERFQVFEHYQSQQTDSNNDVERGITNVKRSASILSKLAKFQKHGMDVGVSNEALDGIPIEESESEDEEEEEIPEGEDPDLVRAKRVHKEKPFHFTAMSDVKKRWEQGDHAREERREETKQEIQNIRTKLFMGKQEKMKEAYQQAVLESESSTNLRKNLSEKIEVCDTKSIKERFEKGEVANERNANQRSEEDEEVYESEISKKSRSMFLELDASASKPPQVSPITPPKLEVKKAREAYLEKTAKEDTVKSTEQIEDVEVRTADIQERFKFFETYKEPEKQRKQFRITPPRDPSQVKTETPEREIYRDPDVVRSEEYVDDSNVAKESHTASKMLNKFRQMEENLSREPEIQGPKPLKCFTPPPEPAKPESRSEEEESSEYEEEEEDQVDQNGKLPEDLIEAQKAARAKQLRAKFEKWEANEIKKEQQQNSVNIVEEFGEEQSQIESTRVLRARFEQMRESSSESSKAPRVKPNRFV